MDGDILINGVGGVSIADTFNASDLTVIDSGGKEGGSYICIANNTAGSSYNEFVIRCKHFIWSLKIMLAICLMFSSVFKCAYSSVFNDAYNYVRRYFQLC